MEKSCKLYTDYTRKEANAQGFCSDCQNSSCPYYDNSNSSGYKNKRNGQNDFETMDRENRKRKNRNKRSNKQPFVRHSDNDDW